MSEKRERELNLETNQISQSTKNIKESKVENLKVNTAYNITNRLLSVGSVYLIIFGSVFLIFGLFNCIIVILLLYSTS